MYMPEIEGYILQTVTNLDLVPREGSRNSTFFSCLQYLDI